MTAVVVVIDVSLSMPMRDLFEPAVAQAERIIAGLACSETDHLVGCIGFSSIARRIDPGDLTNLTWDFVYGSNLADALNSAVQLLDGQRGRLVVLSDLEATAHTNENGEPFFFYPPAPETLTATRRAIDACAAAGAIIEALHFGAGDADRHVESITAAIRATGGTVADIFPDPSGPSSGRS